MRTLEQLSSQQAHSIEGAIVDVDLLLHDGVPLTLGGYAALHALKQAGLRLVACSACPAAWGEALQRVWPVDMVVSENGALAHIWRAGRLDRIDRYGAGERGRRRASLLALVEALRGRVPDLELASDNLGRVSDVTFVPRDEEQERAAVRAAVDLGARTQRSPGRLHLTLDEADKVSGSIHALARAFGVDESLALTSYAFVGGGRGDGVAFGAFALTVGLGTSADDLRELTVAPRFVSGAGIDGLVELATRLGALRG